MKILAVDYGDARTGLAICDAGEMLASPVGVIHSHRMDEVVQRQQKPPGNSGPNGSWSEIPST